MKQKLGKNTTKHIKTRYERRTIITEQNLRKNYARKATSTLLAMYVVQISVDGAWQDINGHTHVRRHVQMIN